MAENQLPQQALGKLFGSGLLRVLCVCQQHGLLCIKLVAKLACGTCCLGLPAAGAEAASLWLTGRRVC